MLDSTQTTATIPGEIAVGPSHVPSFYHTSLELRRLILDMASQGPGTCPGMNLTRAVLSKGTFRELQGESVFGQHASEHDNVVDVVRISSNNGHKQVRLVLMFGEHGRELITVEVGIRLMKALCGYSDVEENLRRWATHVLTYTDFLIFPNVDESGRRSTEDGMKCKRDNFEGVDLNRNWAYRWSNELEKDVGTGPFSEPETDIAHRHVEAFHPNAFLSVHSGDRALWTPGAYDIEVSEEEKKKGHVWEMLLDIAAHVNNLTHCNCRIGAPGQIAQKKHPGTSLDYVGLKMNVPFTMAWEIWHVAPGISEPDTCIPHFSPQGKDEYERVLQSWTMAIFYYAGSVHRVLQGHAPIPLPTAGFMDPTRSMKRDVQSPLSRPWRLRKRSDVDYLGPAGDGDITPSIEDGLRNRGVGSRWMDSTRSHVFAALVFLCCASAFTCLGTRYLQSKS